MRVHLAIALFTAVVAVGCGDKDLNASIEEMNEGVAASNAGQLTSAEKHLEKAASLSGQNHQAWYNLGQVRAQLKKWDEAVDAFANAVKHKGDEAMYHYYLGRAYWEAEERKLSPAATHLEKAVELEERLYKGHYYLGLVYAQQGKPKPAAEAWTKAATLNPSFGKAFNQLAKLYIQWEKLDEAISVLQSGLHEAFTPEEESNLHYHLGLAQEKKGKLQEAADAYTKALQARKDNIDARRQRGFVYAELGNKEKAKEDLQAFVDSGGGGNSFQIQAANDRLFRMMGESSQ